MGDSELTLEETNKLRVSIGLAPLGEAAPLAEGEEPVLDADQVAEANYAKRREEDEKDAETKALQERIDRAKNKRELAAKLTGNTLGDEPTEDASAWAKKAKKRAKQLAAERALVAKREKEQAEMDELGRADLYSEKDLSGIKVGHDLEDFEEGEHILTLKDSRILDGDEDELMNEDLDRMARDEKDKELKKKHTGYSGYDDEEFDPGMLGIKKKVLSKYDVDIEGEQDAGFRLGGSVASKKKRPVEELEESDDIVNRTLLTGGLVYEKNNEVSDYLQEGDAGFKKPKKKKKRSARVVEADEDRRQPTPAGGDSMDVDGPVASSSTLPPPPPPPIENYVDDDELQSALARQRRQKSKKVAKHTPEEIAKQLAEQKAEEQAAAAIAQASQAAAKVEDDTIQFDETSEFVRMVQMQPIVQVIRTSSAPVNAVASSSSGIKEEEEGADVDLDTLMKPSGGDAHMEGEGEPDDEVDEQLAEMALRQGMSIEEMRIKLDTELVKEEQPEADAEMGTAAEAVVGKGLAGTLALLRSTGNLDKTAAPDAKERERIQKEKDLWLADRRRRLAQRELERIQARGGNKDQATLEYEKRMREQKEAADAVEQFKSYKPDINIVYHDEFGRELTPKEAWKALSHRFHGKGSGKGKTDKRLAKIQLERKREAMSMGDTSLSKNFNERAARTGEAYMVLSSGNKATVTEDKSGKKRK